MLFSKLCANPLRVRAYHAVSLLEQTSHNERKHRAKRTREISLVDAANVHIARIVSLTIALLRLWRTTMSLFNARHVVPSLLAFAGAGFISSTASALVFGGNFFVAGCNRVIATNVVQNMSSANLPTLPVRVTLCTGAVEAPAFVVTGPTTAVLAGSCYRMSITIAAVDRTRLLITHTGAPGGISRVELGGLAQKVVFDRRDPNPGTGLSSTGRDVAVLAGAGLWTVNARWTNPIQIGTMPARGDVFNKLTFDFNTCFVSNNSLYVEFDTDEVQ